MEYPWELPTPKYYERLNYYILNYGMPWSPDTLAEPGEGVDHLRPILGEGQGRQALDCTCGWGTQALALAKLGWHVTALDISETSLDFACKKAASHHLSLEFGICDMRDLQDKYHNQFDAAVCCKSLYEIPDDAGILQALRGMLQALKPGGKIYFSLRDHDILIQDKERHIMQGEVRIPHGRLICIDDWDYLSEDEFIDLNAFLIEDERLPPGDHFRWKTETIGHRKRVLRKAHLAELLHQAGFDPVTFLPKEEEWQDVEVLAGKPQR
jgi:SAM-dependent methyltransferase